MYYLNSAINTENVSVNKTFQQNPNVNTLEVISAQFCLRLRQVFLSCSLSILAIPYRFFFNSQLDSVAFFFPVKRGLHSQNRLLLWKRTLILPIVLILICGFAAFLSLLQVANINLSHYTKLALIDTPLIKLLYQMNEHV